MKELNGQAGAQVPADPHACFALVRDVEGYPRWHGAVVREVRVLGRDAEERADRIEAVLRAKIGPIDRDFTVRLALRARVPEEVILERLPHEVGDRESLSMRWTLAPAPEGGAGTRLALTLSARLDLPRLLPIPSGAGDEVARRFVAAAVQALG